MHSNAVTQQQGSGIKLLQLCKLNDGETTVLWDKQPWCFIRQSVCYKYLTYDNSTVWKYYFCNIVCGDMWNPLQGFNPLNGILF